MVHGPLLSTRHGCVRIRRHNAYRARFGPLIRYWEDKTTIMAHGITSMEMTT
jgi:hypothetical protein